MGDAPKSSLWAFRETRLGKEGFRKGKTWLLPRTNARKLSFNNTQWFLIDTRNWHAGLCMGVFILFYILYYFILFIYLLKFSRVLHWWKNQTNCGTNCNIIKGIILHNFSMQNSWRGSVFGKKGVGKNQKSFLLRLDLWSAHLSLETQGLPLRTTSTQALLTTITT